MEKLLTLAVGETLYERRRFFIFIFVSIYAALG